MSAVWFGPRFFSHKHELVEKIQDSWNSGGDDKGTSRNKVMRKVLTSHWCISKVAAHENLGLMYYRIQIEFISEEEVMEQQKVDE